MREQKRLNSSHFLRLSGSLLKRQLQGPGRSSGETFVIKMLPPTRSFSCWIKIISHKRFCTQTRFETKAQNGLEMACWLPNNNRLRQSEKLYSQKRVLPFNLNACFVNLNMEKKKCIQYFTSFPFFNISSSLHSSLHYHSLLSRQVVRIWNHQLGLS